MESCSFDALIQDFTIQSNISNFFMNTKDEEKTKHNRISNVLTFFILFNKLDEAKVKKHTVDINRESTVILLSCSQSKENHFQIEIFKPIYSHWWWKNNIIISIISLSKRKTFDLVKQSKIYTIKMRFSYKCISFAAFVFLEFSDFLRVSKFRFDLISGGLDTKSFQNVYEYFVAVFCLYDFM